MSHISITMFRQASAMGPRDNNDMDGISVIDEETETDVAKNGGGI